MVDLMVRPPKPSEASYARWKEQRDAIYDDLQRKSKMVYVKLNSIPVSWCEGLNSIPVSVCM